MRFAWLTLVLAACGTRMVPDDAGVITDAPLWADGTMTIGSELDGGYVPMPAEVELHPGAQGGFHVPVRYEIVGKTEPDVIFEHQVRRARDGVLVSRGSRTSDVTGPIWDSDLVVVFMCPTPLGVNVEGEEVNFVVNVKRASGALLTTSSTKTVLKCPADNQSFCQSICKG